MQLLSEKQLQDLSASVASKYLPKGYYPPESKLIGLSIPNHGQKWLYQDNGACYELAISNGFSISINDENQFSSVSSSRIAEASNIFFDQVEGNKVIATNVAVLEALLYPQDGSLPPAIAKLFESNEFNTIK